MAGRRSKRAGAAGGLMVWLVFVASLATRAGAVAAPLAGAEQVAYARWVALLAVAPDSARAVPYPQLHGAPPPGSRAGDSRAVAAFEQALAGPASRRPAGAASALAAARAYLRLGEYEAALLWYGEAGLRGLSPAAEDSVRRESAAAAVALGDSLALARFVVNATGLGDLRARPDEVALAVRALVGRGDREGLSLLAGRLEAQARPLPPILLFWRAFAGAELGDWSGALGALRELLADPQAPGALAAWQREWTAGALADLLLLVGEADDAARLYRVLAAGGTPRLAAWSRYQLANFDLLAGRVRAARAAFAGICKDDTDRPWRPRACALAAAADTLANLAGLDGADDADRLAGR